MIPHFNGFHSVSTPLLLSKQQQSFFLGHQKCGFLNFAPLSALESDVPDDVHEGPVIGGKMKAPKFYALDNVETEIIRIMNKQRSTPAGTINSAIYNPNQAASNSTTSPKPYIFMKNELNSRINPTNGRIIFPTAGATSTATAAALDFFEGIPHHHKTLSNSVQVIHKEMEKEKEKLLEQSRKEEELKQALLTPAQIKIRNKIFNLKLHKLKKRILAKVEDAKRKTTASLPQSKDSSDKMNFKNKKIEIDFYGSSIAVELDAKGKVKNFDFIGKEEKERIKSLITVSEIESYANKNKILEKYFNPLLELTSEKASDKPNKYEHLPFVLDTYPLLISSGQRTINDIHAMNEGSILRNSSCVFSDPKFDGFTGETVTERIGNFDNYLQTLKSQKDGKYRLPIKLYISNFDDRTMPVNILKNITAQFISPFGIVHSGLLVGPYVLDWHKDCLVYPRPYRANKTLAVIDLGEKAHIELTKSNLSKMCDFLAFCNNEIGYSKFISSWDMAKKYRKMNCHGFVNGFLENLGINLKEEWLPNGPIEKFLNHVKWNNNKSKRQISNYSGIKSKVFKTHEDLDKFYANEFLKIKKDKTKRGEWTREDKETEELLFAFDRSFWMKGEYVHECPFLQENHTEKMMIALTKKQ